MRRLNIVHLDSLAKFLNTSVDNLCQIANSANNLYSTSTKQKKNFGVRILAKPKYRLKILQQKIKKLLCSISLPLSVHGWVKGRSVKTATRIHAGKRYLYAFDIKSYFDSIHSKRIYRLFQKELNCSPDVSRILTQLSTYHYCLPQGSPCSPVLANLVLRNFDAEIDNYARKRKADYSRLGDDVIISSNHRIPDVKQVIIFSLRKNGLKVNIEKQILGHPHKSGEKVLGIVIGKSISVTRNYRDTIRAILRNARKTGLEAQNIEGRFNFKQHIQGRIAVIKIYHEQEGYKLQQELRKIPDKL